MKKLIASLLSVLMVLMLLPSVTFAEDIGNLDSQNVAEVNGTKYATLIDAINAAGSGQTIKLLENYEVTTGEWTTYLLPDNSTLDLGQKTLTVPYATAVFEGSGITIQNGRIDSEANYAIWIGNGENDTSVTLKNVSSNGGVNVFAATATLEECNINAGSKEYYAVWSDEASSITIKSGEYTGGENGAVGTAATEGYEGKIDIYGGTFTFDKLVPNENNDNVTIHGGEFSKKVDSKYVDQSVNLIKVDDKWTTADADKTTTNDDGSKTETKSEVADDGSSTVTETTTKTDASTGAVTIEEVVTQRDSNGKIIKKVETNKVITKTGNVTTTEQTVTTTDANGNSTTSTSKTVLDKDNNVTITTKVEGNTAKSEVGVADSATSLPKPLLIDATAISTEASKVTKSEVTLKSDFILAANKVSNGVESLSIKSDVGTMNIDSTATKTFIDAAGANALKLVLAKTDLTVDETKSITATYELAAYVNDKPIFTEDDEDNGTVSVSVAYSCGDGNTPEVYYVPESGNKVLMKTTFENNILSWETSHFSTFEVLETATEVTNEEASETAEADNNAVSSGISETGDGVGLLVLFITIIMGASVFVLARVSRKFKQKI